MVMTKGRTSLDYCSFLHCCDSAFLNLVLCNCVWSSIGCVLSAHRNDAPFDDPVPYLLTDAPAHSAQRRTPCKRRQRDAVRCPTQGANCRRECAETSANDYSFDAATGREERAATYARGTRPKYVNGAIGGRQNWSGGRRGRGRNGTRFAGLNAVWDANGNEYYVDNEGQIVTGPIESSESTENIPENSEN